MQMTIQEIRTAITATPALYALLPDSAAIAAAMSVGRTVVIVTYGGIGTIMKALGKDRGSAVLDALQSMSASNNVIRWGLEMIRAGQLDFANGDTRSMIDMLVAGNVISATEGAALKSIAEVPDPVDELSVRRAIWNDDGTRAV